MLARNISLRLKPNMLSTFTTTLEGAALAVPEKTEWLPGFAGAPKRKRVCNVDRLWVSKEHADGYTKNAYQQVLKSLEPVLDGARKVRTTTVVRSTAHQLVPVTA